MQVLITDVGKSRKACMCLLLTEITKEKQNWEQSKPHRLTFSDPWVVLPTDGVLILLPPPKPSVVLHGALRMVALLYPHRLFLPPPCSSKTWLFSEDPSREVDVAPSLKQPFGVEAGHSPYCSPFPILSAASRWLPTSLNSRLLWLKSLLACYLGQII